jgi:hypothetical protein
MTATIGSYQASVLEVKKSNYDNGVTVDRKCLMKWRSAMSLHTSTKNTKAAKTLRRSIDQDHK